jgi:hypothetical protein
MSDYAFSSLGPDAEFIGAGDDVVWDHPTEGILRGVLVDVEDDGRATVNIGGGDWVHASFSELAHPDSPRAQVWGVKP